MFGGILKSAKEEKKKKMVSQGNETLANRRRVNKEKKMDLLQDV